MPVSGPKLSHSLRVPWPGLPPVQAGQGASPSSISGGHSNGNITEQADGNAEGPGERGQSRRTLKGIVVSWGVLHASYIPLVDVLQPLVTARRQSRGRESQQRPGGNSKAMSMPADAPGTSMLTEASSQAEGFQLGQASGGAVASTAAVQVAVTVQPASLPQAAWEALCEVMGDPRVAKVCCSVQEPLQELACRGCAVRGVIWSAQHMHALARPKTNDPEDASSTQTGAHGALNALNGTGGDPASQPDPEVRSMQLKALQQEVLPQYRVIVPLQQDADAITSAGHAALLAWAMAVPLQAMLLRDGLLQRYK